MSEEIKVTSNIIGLSTVFCIVCTKVNVLDLCKWETSADKQLYCFTYLLESKAKNNKFWKTYWTVIEEDNRLFITLFKYGYR